MTARPPLRLDRCPSCGSVFREHVCTGPYVVTTCVCEHPAISHHHTPKRATWCTVADPHPCPCTVFKEARR